MIGSAVGGYLDPAQIEGPRLKDAQVQTSDEGAPRAIVYGIAAVAGNVIQRGPLIERKKTERQGKGGPETTTYRYFMSYAIRVCEGPGRRILRIWRDDKLVYDVRPGSGFNADTAAFKTKLTIYDGGETQLPDPVLEALPGANGGGVGNVPAYRGTCYVVFENDDLTDRNGTIPQYRFEVASAATETEAVCPKKWMLIGNEVGSNGGSSGRYLLAGHEAEFATGTKQEAISDGFNWLDANGRCIRGDDGQLLLHSDSFNWVISPDKAETWAEHGNVDSLGGGWDKGVFSSGVYYIPRASGGYTRVDESGVSLGNTSYPCESMCAVGNRVYGCRNTGNQYSFLYADDGAAFSSALVEEAYYLYDSSMATDGTVVLCLAKADHNSTAYLIELKGEDGGVPVFGTVAGGAPRAYEGTSTDMTAILRYGGGSWIAAYGDGKVYRSATGKGGWAQVADFGVIIRDMDYSEDDDLWVLVGEGGLCATSSDGGRSFEAVPTAFGTNALWGVTYIGDPQTGTEIPDAPGFYVQEDGSITSGCTAATLDPDTTILSTVVQDICERVGLDGDQLSLSPLTDSLTGFVIGRQMPATEALKPLQQAYFWDFPEWDLKLRAVKRGGAVVKALTDDDFVQSDADEETRGQAVEFPRKLHLFFADPDANYARVPATAERVSENVQATGEMSIEAPLTLTRAEAFPIADKQLKIAWERMLGTMQRKLPAYAHADLTPTDCVTYDSKRWMIDRIEAVDGVLDVQFTRDRASAYQSNATPNDILSPTPPPSSLAGPTMFAVLNLPALRDEDDAFGVYVGVSGLLDSWNGARIDLSRDGGTTFQTVIDVADATVMGVLTADLIDGPVDFIDRSSTLAVRVFDGELDSLEFNSLLMEGNAAAIVNDDGTAEIIQFGEAAPDGSLYDLSFLIRGRLNTETSAHASGSQFVMLERVYFVPLTLDDVGRTLVFRPVSIGTTPENNVTYEHVYSPAPMAPWPVYDIAYERDGSGNLLVEWIGRARLGSDANPQHSESFEGYRVTVTDGTTIRSWDTTLQQFQLSSADQVAVFGSDSFVATVTVEPIAGELAQIAVGGTAHDDISQWTAAPGWSQEGGRIKYDPVVGGASSSHLVFASPIAVSYPPQMWMAVSARVEAEGGSGRINVQHYRANGNATTAGQSTSDGISAYDVPLYIDATHAAPVLAAYSDGVSAVYFSQINYTVHE